MNAMIASNTWECFQACIGRKVVAVLQIGGGMHDPPRRLLIMDEGWALALYDSGAYSIESASDVRRWASERREELARCMADVLAALSSRRPGDDAGEGRS